VISLALVLALALAALLPSAVEAQTLDCGRIPFCNSCTTKRVGTVTRLFCLGCTTGYNVARDQRSCMCGPGFYWDSFQTSCEPCGIGAWCV